MPRRILLLGHPPHPPATHFPLAFLLAVPAADGAAWALGGAGWFRLSFILLAAGCVTSLPAMATGFMEYLSLVFNPPAGRDVNRHMVLALSSVSLDVASLLVRGGPEILTGARWGWSAVLSALAAGLLSLAGWYGGRLVFTHRAGLEDIMEGHDAQGSKKKS